jgi:60 kDa SS-A/Ro ribonucleoprotein
MSRFNKSTPTPSTQTVNKAGGVGYTETPELALVSLLLTSFAQDQFYRTADQTFAELKDLLSKVDPKFAAQALLYARRTFGMRSITHVGASELSRSISGQPWAKSFFDLIVFRPDDMTEIAAYHLAQNYKLTNAMRKGFAAALNRFDGYQLAKYKGEGKKLPLKYVLNRAHPHPIDEVQSGAYHLLSRGELKNSGTWEAELSAAGGDSKKKAAAWSELLANKKLGYLALVRNLRNIIQDAPEAVATVCSTLINIQLIQKAKVLPFQYNTAYEEVMKLPSSKEVRTVLASLQKAFDQAMINVPVWDGETLVVLDVSGSMSQGDAKPAKIGAQFATMLARANNADLMTFDTAARYITYNPGSSAQDIINRMPFVGGGTDFTAILSAMNNKHYDRIVILSDMQGWAESNGWLNGEKDAFRTRFNAYRQRHAKPVRLYSFDLAGYGSLKVPERNTFVLAGFSEKIFDVMKALEEDPQALVNTVKQVAL